MKNIYRNQYCGLIAENDVGQEIQVAGGLEISDYS